MNLMSMINGLERMDNAQPFSAAAYKLASKVIALCNSLHWQCEVSIDLNRIASMSACSSRHTALQAREELISRGVLTVIQKGSKGKPSLYRLNDVSEYGAKSAPQVKYSADNAPNSSQCGANSAQNHPKYGAGCGVNFALISRQDYIYNDDKRAHDPLTVSDEEVRRHQDDLAAIEDAARGIGLPFAPSDLLMVEQLIADYSAQWVLEAIKRTQERNRTWGVVKGILRSWKDKGGIDDARNQQGAGGNHKPLHGAGQPERKYDMSGSYL